MNYKQLESSRIAAQTELDKPLFKTLWSKNKWNWLVDLFVSIGIVNILIFAPTWIALIIGVLFVGLSLACSIYVAQLEREHFLLRLVGLYYKNSADYTTDLMRAAQKASREDSKEDEE